MSKRIRLNKIVPLLFWIGLLFAGITGCNLVTDQDDPWTSNNKETSRSLPTINEIVLNPPRSLDYYPCNDCHSELEVNTQRRELVDMHDDIIFNHDSEHRWCLDCHDATNRDSLRLANGRLIAFDVSYELCGQCHGPKFRDWKLGIHGKRSGEWNGQKTYYRCVHCHDPHSPRFKLLEPMPAPLKPLEISFDSLTRYGNEE